MAGPKLGSCWGPKQFPKISKRLAHLLGYDNLDTNTGHSNQKAGVTIIQNTEGIGAGLKVSMCRHKGEVVTSGYNATTQLARDRASAALLGVLLSYRWHVRAQTDRLTVSTIQTDEEYARVIPFTLTAHSIIRQYKHTSR
jgi:hypothetical protein